MSKQKKINSEARNTEILRGAEVELGGEADEKEQIYPEVIQEEAQDVSRKTGGDAEEQKPDEGSQQRTENGETEEKIEELDKPAEEQPAKLSFWHRMNVSYPWLKFAAAVVVMAGVMMGGFGVASLVEGSHEVINPPEATEPVEPDAPAEGSGKEIVEPPAEEKPEEPAESEGEANNNGGGGGNTAQPPTTPVVVPEGATGKKLIALTFDDGPSTATTARLLDILRDKNVKATFFVLGNMAQRAPALVQREEAEGHEVGSHTPWHNQQTKLSAASIQAEAATMNQIFMEILGHGPVFTRPPYGAVNEVVRANLPQPLILWSIDPEDWKYRNVATVRANVVRAAHDGAIALMHDIHATTVDAVPGIIDDLRAQGYEFLTVSELAKARGVGLANGWTYYNFRP